MDQLEQFAAGFAGFVVFEAYRIYKKTSDSKPPFPKETFPRIIHLIVLVILATFSGYLAYLWGVRVFNGRYTWGSQYQRRSRLSSGSHSDKGDRPRMRAWRISRRERYPLGGPFWRK